MKRVAEFLVCGILTMCVVAACAALPATRSAYREEIARTALTARSAINTAVLVVRAVERGQAARPYVRRTLSYAEGDLRSAAGSFSVIQPPGEEEARQRDELMVLLNQSERRVSALRIAARLGELDRLPEIAAPLSDLDRRLEPFERLA